MQENPIIKEESFNSAITKSPEKISLFNLPIFETKIFPLFNKYKATQLNDEEEKLEDNTDILEINIPVIGSELASSEVQINPYDNGYTGDLDERSQDSMLEFKILDNSTYLDVDSEEFSLETTTVSAVPLENLGDSTFTTPDQPTTLDILTESSTKENFWIELKKEQRNAEGLMQAINKVVIIPHEENSDPETAKVFSLLAEKIAQKQNISEVDDKMSENINYELDKQEKVLEEEIFGSSSDVVNKYIPMTLKEQSDDEILTVGSSKENVKGTQIIENIQPTKGPYKEYESLQQSVLKFIDNLKVDKQNYPQIPMFEPTPAYTYTIEPEDLSTPRTQERVYRHQNESPSIKELTDELDRLIQIKMKEYAQTEIENQMWLKNLELNAFNSRFMIETTTLSSPDSIKHSSKKFFIPNKNPHEILSAVMKKVRHPQGYLARNNPQPSYKTRSDDQYNDSMEISDESQEKIQICKFGDSQKSNCVKRSPNEEAFPRFQPNPRLADWTKQYRIPDVLKRRQETSMERIDRVNSNLDRMMQFVSVVSQKSS